MKYADFSAVVPYMHRNNYITKISNIPNQDISLHSVLSHLPFSSIHSHT